MIELDSNRLKPWHVPQGDEGMCSTQSTKEGNLTPVKTVIHGYRFKFILCCFSGTLGQVEAAIIILSVVDYKKLACI